MKVTIADSSVSDRATQQTMYLFSAERYRNSSNTTASTSAMRPKISKFTAMTRLVQAPNSIQIDGQLVNAVVQREPFYDPDGARLKS